MDDRTAQLWSERVKKELESEQILQKLLPRHKLPWYKKAIYKIRWLFRDRRPYIPVISLDDERISDTVQFDFDDIDWGDLNVKKKSEGYIKFNQ